MRLAQAAQIARAGVLETPVYMAFPREHWTRLRTNNTLERMMREIRRRLPRRPQRTDVGRGPRQHVVRAWRYQPVSIHAGRDSSG